MGRDYPELVPSAERVKFTGSGTEATMMAVRLARAYTGRQKFLKFQGHFHGWSDAMTAGFQAPFNVPSSVGVTQTTLEGVIVAPRTWRKWSGYSPSNRTI